MASQKRLPPPPHNNPYVQIIGIGRRDVQISIPISRYVVGLVALQRDSKEERGMVSMKKALKAFPAGNLEKIRRLPVKNLNKNSEFLKLLI